ncbi:flavin-containing monooxygenase [Novosphingobium aerophilum]|uniref:NAD(P)/FAD-dependent oxidoreductase n=1 Tax=Novosphingobium aerophilum TaxID=2839843 RepID=A0A7X1KAR7_9SPHN|nr:NAD(P)/FAD-dependent oxidoreductase [Novosphingobium aerophilum]MBC2650448.1 NAD(P)/FAD-dependent oxidoreductase [Novosphingobium aerophilum]
MTCQPTTVPSPDTFDIPALREKYRIEKDRRMRREGQAQYVRLGQGDTGDLALDPYAPVAPRAALDEELDVLVLGAGWGGIKASYHLTKLGVTSIRNVDTAGDFGGVWYWNKYPGVQCDNDAYCYLPLLEEMGFLPSKKFADGNEIQAYARSIAERFGFADKALLHTQVTSFRWDEGLRRWIVTTNRGDTLRPRFVVVAPGVLNMPKLPAIKGIDQFRGKLFHTSRWDYGYTGGSPDNATLDRLADKRVAIVGTGATAIQAVPHLARHAKHLYVIQRTPSTVDERPNPPTDPEWAAALQPGWQARRIANFHRGAQEVYQFGEEDLICDIWTEINRNLAAQIAAGGREIPLEEYFARREIMDFQVMERLRARCDELVKDPQTAAALKPWYHHLCKRPLSSNDYYPTFNRDNVTLVDVSDTQGIQELTETGFIANGQEHPVDCVIFASGFEVTSDLNRRWGIPQFEGAEGRSIYDHWRDGPLTFHGITTHGFPNMAFIGYIQGGINSSVTEHFGRQGAHAAWIFAECLKRGISRVEPSQAAMDAYVRTYNEIKPDVSALQQRCPPGYFNNEGEANPKWALFPGWGYGWDNFEAMLAEWRDKGDMEGMVLA